MAVVLLGVAASACSDDGARSETSPAGIEPVAADRADGTSPTDAGTSDTDVEIRPTVGPRAFDPAAGTMLVLDSMDLDGDDILVRMRVVNASDEFFDLGVTDTFYGPLAYVRDDRDHSYAARAVHPTGIDAWSVGDLRLRIQGPLDPTATEFSLELVTSRGSLTTDPVPVPSGDGVRWWLEDRPEQLDQPIVATSGGRTVDVVAVTDRGAYVEVSLDASGPTEEPPGPSGVGATVTGPDGTEFVLVPVDPSASEADTASRAVVRAVGRPDTGATMARLGYAGVVVDIPRQADGGSASTTGDPPLGVSPRLPDLIDMWITDEPLPSSTFAGG